MRRYELMLLLRPDLEDDKLQSAVEKVTRAIVNGGGSLSKVSPWGKRRLAYDIQNFRDASYFLIQFDIEPSAVREIERGMLISEEILRHLVTLLEERPGSSDELVDAAADMPEQGAPAPAEPRREAESEARPEPLSEARPEPQSEADDAASSGDDSDATEAEPATAGS
ncbi:MAG TPA: 30S ribosomal protein S6 [Candidatus Limnocylindria bacterium]|nr:30S ribosomal protein S6 [Candidatus Limnocylindria bacterium]